MEKRGFTASKLSLLRVFRRPIMSLKRKAESQALIDAKKPKANSSITSFFGPPKTVSSSTKVAGSTTETIEPPQIKFDKEKWVAKLTDEQKELLKLEIETLHESWLSQLKDEVTSKEFLELKRFLKKELDSGKKIFPPMEDVYSWFVVLVSPTHNCSLNPGPGTPPSTLSRQSSSAKTPIITSIKPTECAFLSAHRRLPLLPSKTSTSA